MVEFAAGAALALSAVGTLVSGFGLFKQGKDAKTQAQFQANTSRRNAAMAELAAQDAIRRGSEDENALRLQFKQLKGRQRAAFAANGVIVDQGSALDLVLDTVSIGERDALTTRDNATREANTFREQGDEFNSSALLQTRAGRDSQTAGNIGAAGTLLSGSASVAAKWFDYFPPKRKGIE